MSKLETRFCSDTNCLREIFKPHLYCDKHQDESSTPPAGSRVDPASSKIEYTPEPGYVLPNGQEVTQMIVKNGDETILLNGSQVIAYMLAASPSLDEEELDSLLLQVAFEEVKHSKHWLPVYRKAFIAWATKSKGDV